MLDPPEFDPKEQSLSLAPGDAILAYSDGAIELERAEGDLLGVAGFTAIVERCRKHASGAGLCAALMREIAPLRDRSGNRDDTLIVRVAIEEPAPKPAAPENASA